jgi:hypothetical protein
LLRSVNGSTSWLGLIVCALLLGVAWMHTVSAAPVHSTVAVGVPDCTMEPHGQPCPDDHHDGGHATAMCQSAAVSTMAQPEPLATIPGPAAGTPFAGHLLGTVAPDAAGGTGCGPPSLTALCVLRT